MDRLPWSRWHWLVVLALGITWILDGLEVTIVGTVSDTLKKGGTLNLGDVGVTGAASSYVAGAVVGALGFGYLTDRLGRKRLFLITLGWYTLFTICTAGSWDLLSYCGFRFLTGVGIGGEYAAINSAIDELIPARRRGWTDLAINSSYWMGTVFASMLSLVLLDPRYFPVNVGWRLSFALGAVLALGVLAVRRLVPESPRWLMTHGRHEEAEKIVREIEATVERQHGQRLPEPSGTEVTIDTSKRVGLLDMVHTMASTYPRRSFVALSLMVTQAFLYNAVFFTMALVLTTFFKVEDSSIGYYIAVFALGNMLGPWILGHLFDVVGRRAMIGGSYIVSAALMVLTGVLFQHGALSATTITACWCGIFFFASAGASAAYLTASEIFPMETRALAIAIVYAAGTAVGGITGPLLFGVLIGTKQVGPVFGGYLLGAGMMLAGGLVEILFGIDAEQRSLEDIASPLTSVELTGTPVRLGASAHAAARPR